MPWPFELSGMHCPVGHSIGASGAASGVSGGQSSPLHGVTGNFVSESVTYLSPTSGRWGFGSGGSWRGLRQALAPRSVSVASRMGPVVRWEPRAGAVISSVMFLMVWCPPGVLPVRAPHSERRAMVERAPDIPVVLGSTSSPGALGAPELAQTLAPCATAWGV